MRNPLLIWHSKETGNHLLVVMAQIKAKTSRTAIELHDWKLHLVRLLYKGGYSKAMVLELFHSIDWMIILPRGLDEQFKDAVYHIEKEGKVAYITSISVAVLQSTAWWCTFISDNTTNML